MLNFAGFACPTGFAGFTGATNFAGSATLTDRIDCIDYSDCNDCNDFDDRAARNEGSPDSDKRSQGQIDAGHGALRARRLQADYWRKQFVHNVL